MTLLTDNEKANAVRSYARQCNGSDRFVRHPLARRLLYTGGVEYLAQVCGAHWLIDAIASHHFTNKAVRAEPFQTWELRPLGDRGVDLVCTDGGKDGNEARRIVSQLIEYSDFPRELLPFRLFCEEGAPHTEEDERNAVGSRTVFNLRIAVGGINMRCKVDRDPRPYEER